MASSSSKSDMKGFYKQRKTAISKSKGKSTPSPKTAQSPSLLTKHKSPDLKDEYNEKEEMMRQFDMNMAYGPCLGMSRLQRFVRAKALGLNPPEEIEDLLSSSKVSLDCLWDGRV